MSSKRDFNRYTSKKYRSRKAIEESVKGVAKINSYFKCTAAPTPTATVTLNQDDAAPADLVLISRQKVFSCNA